MIKQSHLQTFPTQIPKDLAPSLRVNSSIAISKDGFGIADVLAQKLRALGCQATVVDTLPNSCDVAIVLDALQPIDSKEQAIALNAQIFAQIKQIAAKFAESGGKLRAVEDTGGQFGLTNTPKYAAWAAGVSGLIKTAGEEWAKASCKIIDLQRADQTLERLADRLLAEIIYDDQHKEVGLLADGRRMAINVGAPLNAEYNAAIPGQELAEGDVLIVTGGARGVTAACLIELAQKVKLKFVLFGRTALADGEDEFADAKTEAELKPRLFEHYKQNNIKATPKDIQSHIATILSNREIRHTLASLKAAGSSVEYLPVNVLDEAELQNAVNNIRQQWGEIAGVVHGAGVLADKLILEKTTEQFQKVFNTKVLGLKNLLSVTKNDDLKVLALFSSVAGRFGNPGQCDYAMANEVLNKVAQDYQRQHPECIVKSINWGPWESGMVNAQLKKLFANRGVALIPVDVGAQIFVDELFKKDKQVEVVVGGTLNPTEKNNTMRFSVSQATHAFLSDHVVKEVPVLPACLALEWFVQAANKLQPTLTLNEVENFRVLRGIQLSNFYQQPEEFVVTCNEDSAIKHKFKLTLSKAGSPAANYSAEICMGDNRNTVPTSVKIDALSATQLWPFTKEQIYTQGENTGLLFHGCKFHTIDALEKISDQTATAKVSGLKRLDWPGSWCTDALAVDAVFQVGRLWGQHMLDKPSLPAAFQSLKIYQEELAEKPLQCVVYNARLKGKLHIVYDAVLQTAEGKTYAEFKDVQEVCYDV